MIISEYCLNLALAVHIFVFVKLAESVINHSGFSSPENGLKIPGKLSAMMIKQKWDGDGSLLDFLSTSSNQNLCLSQMI